MVVLGLAAAALEAVEDALGKRRDSPEVVNPRPDGEAPRALRPAFASARDRKARPVISSTSRMLRSNSRSSKNGMVDDDESSLIIDRFTLLD